MFYHESDLGSILNRLELLCYQWLAM